MSVYTIADLHLPGKEGDNKSMEIFGSRWIGCVNKLINNWSAIVSNDDTVVIPGDISWAMTLEDATEDFKLLNDLPGTKIIGKGNHDFWWATASKMNKFFEQNKFDTLKILYNNSYVIENLVICGSRGWFSDEANQKTVGEVDWTKIVDRETARLKLSLESVPAEHRGLQKLVFLHFPPVWNSSVSTDIISLMKEHGVERCYYGHIHGVYNSDAVFIYDGIRFEMISADYLSFCPRKIII
jgi:predicted phosphohydrolase